MTSHASFLAIELAAIDDQFGLRLWSFGRLLLRCCLNRLAVYWQTRFLRIDPPIPSDHLHPLFIKQREQLFSNEDEITLHEPDRDCGHDGLQDADPVAFANASSRRRFSCSALKLASAFGIGLLG
jgi:hypothetical protein